MYTKVVVKLLNYPNNLSIINKAMDNGNVCDKVGCMDDTGIWAAIAVGHNRSVIS